MAARHEGLAPRRRASRLLPAWSLARETVTAWIEDHASSRAAALSYYAVFSLAPILVIALGVAGALLGEGAARGQLHLQLQSTLGDHAAEAVEQLVASAARPQRSTLATIVGVAMLLFAATGAFAELQNALNAFWKVPPHRTTGVLQFLKRRAISVAVVFSIGVLLLGSVLTSAALSAFGDWGLGLRVLDHTLSFGVMTLLFAMIFRLLPELKVKWREVWLGAVTASLLFTLGKIAIALLPARSAFASAYGAVGAVAVLLAWIYYSSLIVLLGAELTQVVAHRTAR